MTLIVALLGKDGHVLAADSRGTIGDPRGLTAINDTHIKIFRLSEHCGIGISGSSELAAALVDELRQVITAKALDDADAILNETRELARQRYDDWFRKIGNAAERPAVILTLVGFQPRDGTHVPRTYLLQSPTDFAPMLFTKGTALSGVPQYAVYLMHRLYNPEAGVKDLSRLAAYLISETASQDPKVGGPIRIATVTLTGGYAELPAAEVDAIVQRNDRQSQRLKKFFYKGGTGA